MLISQGFNPETRDLETFVEHWVFNPETGDLETSVEHCERAETMDNIAGLKFTASDEDSDTNRNKKRLKFKGQNDHG